MTAGGKEIPAPEHVHRGNTSMGMKAATTLVLRCAFLLFGGALSATRASAQVPDTIRGRVATDSGAAIAGATVVATRAPDRAFKSAVTDDRGRYEIIFEQGTGDYLLHVAAAGRRSERQRVRRSTPQNPLSHDFQLKSSVQQLETVTVSAETNKPEREESRRSPEPGESSRQVDGVTGAVAPGSQGNLAAMAATIPGVFVTPDGGVSVLGLSPLQNGTTLNGMAFSGADIPRSAQTNMTVSGSSYDPARGWFSGAQINVELTPGSLFTSGTARFSVDAPVLQYNDRISNALGERFSSFIAGIGRSGSFALDKMNYSYAVDGGRRTSDLASLEAASPELLRRSGLASDSVTRLLSVLSATGIPRSSGALVDRKTEYLSFIGRIDHARYNEASGEPAKQTWGVTGFAKIERSSAEGVGATATAQHGGENSRQVFSVQGLFSTYLRDFRYLTEARTALTLKRDQTQPYLAIPQGQVLMSSQLTDAGTVTPVYFGGNSSLDQNSRDWTWETSSITRFYTSRRSSHRVQLTATSRLDGFSRSGPSDELGTFSFNSLADLYANVPSAFTRTFNERSGSARVWNAFAAVGDYWRKSQTLQLQYGVRLEANRFLDRPKNNPEVERVFGARTNRLPAGFHASPRLGFTWVRRPSREGYVYNRLGRFNSGHLSYIRGGVGEFRTLLSPMVLATSIGLPGGLTRLTCLGAGAPAPDWRSYQVDPGTIPTQCLSGPGIPPPYTDAAPSVQLLSESYRPPRSWRGNLSYASGIGALIYTIEGVYSLNRDQPGRRDLNFDAVTRFRTSGEDRPVFVDPSSVVQSSGLVSDVDARKSTAFGSVISHTSDLRSVSKRVTLMVSPDLQKVSGWFLSTAYSLSSMRMTASGFDAPTFGSPLERSWSRGNLDARHQFQLQAGRAFKRTTLTLTGQFQSGMPFTPVVSSDVNGDGIPNDRAFIFLPGASGSDRLDEGLRQLKAGSSRSIRNCLTRQSGRPAGRYSCEGPWTASLHAHITRPLKIPSRIGQSASIALAIDNPLGGLDQLLHGSNGLRGWGTPSFPNPVLYNVRGFDPAANRFLYEVNSRFGNTSPANTSVRAPFRITLDVSIDIGPPMPMQQIERWLGAGRGIRPGPRLTSEELKRRFKRNVPDPYFWILQYTDSLLLSIEQEKALEGAQQTYARAVDSLWTPLAEHFAGLPQTFDARDAAKRQDDVTGEVWEFTRLELQRTLPGILNPMQLKMLPNNVGWLFESPTPVQIRMYMN